jgi:hypothetical protein
MWTNNLCDLGNVLPIVVSTDAFALASALDRAADTALFWGRVSYAEYLARRAADLREAAQ